jgi:hypothetical protein
LVNDLLWIYCHIFDPRVPPDDNWVFTGTVITLCKNDPFHEPLSLFYYRKHDPSMIDQAIADHDNLLGKLWEAQQ